MRMYYLLVLDDYQEETPRIITEGDYKESDIETSFPYAFPFTKLVTRKADKVIYESPFDDRKVVIELIKY